MKYNKLKKLWQNYKSIPSGRRSSKGDEQVEKKQAIIETVAAWMEVLEKEFRANISYNIDEITFKQQAE